MYIDKIYMIFPKRKNVETVNLSVENMMLWMLFLLYDAYGAFLNYKDMKYYVYMAKNKR